MWKKPKDGSQSNMELFDQIGNIELKVRQLIKKIERLTTENTKLLAERKALKETLATQQADTTIFKEKITQVKKQFEEEKGDNDSKKIERYLGEINQCMEWMMEQE
ncbi:MAG: hypothetical protein AAGG68_19380 [Bacteroidota bacterium]